VERVIQITPYDTFDQGIDFVFRGIERDQDGEPIGDMVTVTLTIPPLNFDSLKRDQAKIASMGEMETLDSMHAMVGLTRRALAQNYRGVPLWLIEQSINVANLSDLSRATMDLNGMFRKETEAGKALAAASTGTPSTAT
jgi:hypothetical protein